MKNKLTILLNILVIFINACSKNDPQVEPTATPNNPNSTTSNTTIVTTPKKIDNIMTGSNTVKYSYDANGRCIREEGSNTYTTYSYSTNKVTATTVSTQSNLIKTYTLNSSGLATQCTYSSSTKSYLIDYEYNSRKQLTKRTLKSKTPTSTYYSTEYTDTYTYDNVGNYTMINHQLNFVSLRYEYLYDQTKFNTTGNEYKGLDWLGKGSINLPTRMITLEMTTDPISLKQTSQLYWTYYSWAFDAQGYAVKKNAIGDFAGITSFTYK